MATRNIPIGVTLGIALVAIAAVAGALLVTYTISNTANLHTVGVGVYWDSGFADPVTSIDWGTLSPGSTVDNTIYVRNEGTTPFMLNMTTDNWNPPSALTHITVSWNREGYVLDSGEYVEAILTMTVSPSVSGFSSFSFDIMIAGTD